MQASSALFSNPVTVAKVRVKKTKPPVGICGDAFVDIAVVESSTTDKYGFNITKEIDAYLSAGFKHMTMFRWANRSNGEAQLACHLSKTESPTSRKVVFKNGNRGGTMLFDEHKRFLLALGLNDQDAFKMVHAGLHSDTHTFLCVPHNPTAGIITGDPILAVTAPRLGNRSHQVALSQLSSRSLQTEFQAYATRVRSSMALCERLHGHRFGNPHLRNTPNVARDHVFSIKEAFVNNVQESVVGHWSNMRYLSRDDNSSKSDRSDKDIYQLYTDYGIAENNVAHAMKLMEARSRV